MTLVHATHFLVSHHHDTRCRCCIAGHLKRRIPSVRKLGKSRQALVTAFDRPGHTR